MARKKIQLTDATEYTSQNLYETRNFTPFKYYTYLYIAL